MRLDKFLAKVQLIKRRTLANEVCDKGLVKINGKTAKSAKEVRIGDILTIEMFGKKKMIKILDIPEGNIPKNLISGYYEVIEDKDEAGTIY